MSREPYIWPTYLKDAKSIVIDAEKDWHEVAEREPSREDDMAGWFREMDKVNIALKRAEDNFKHLYRKWQGEITISRMMADIPWSEMGAFAGRAGD